MKDKYLLAGAAAMDITPQDSHFLFGYPFVQRMSTGVHDPLLSSVLFMSDGSNQVFFISNDLIYIDKKLTARIRKRVSEIVSISESNILIAATHTHSGPVTAELLISPNDPVIPRVDSNYLRFVEDSIVNTAVEAFKNREIAEYTIVVGDATGIGTNRHDPNGKKDVDVPAMIIRNNNNKFIACMLICNMHPTVLHEDSTLYSSDFPYFIRKKLQETLLGEECPVIYFTGAAGNQSPRHVTKANTFSEAKRVGNIVADAIISEYSEDISFVSFANILIAQEFVNFPKRDFPSIEWAKQYRDTTKERFQFLKKNSSIRQEIRTAEVNWFGSEELLYLTSLDGSKSMDNAYETSLPAEVQIIKIGKWSFIAWPGEIFIEFLLDLKNQFEKVSMITYANGELQGYIVTKEAFDKGYYEAGNSLFDYRAGEVLLSITKRLLNEIKQ